MLVPVLSPWLEQCSKRQLQGVSRIMGIHHLLALHPSVVSSGVGRVFLESDTDAPLFHGLCRLFCLGVLHQAIRSLVCTQCLADVDWRLSFYGGGVSVSVGTRDDGFRFGGLLAFLWGEYGQHGIRCLLFGKSYPMARQRCIRSLGQSGFQAELCHLFRASHDGPHLARMVGRCLLGSLYPNSRDNVLCFLFLVCRGVDALQITESEGLVGKLKK